MNKDELLKLVTVLQAELDATNRQVEILSDALAESRREVAQLKAQPAPVQEPRCAVIVEVFGTDWRLDYMSLPVGKHKLYTQQYVYTTPPAAQPAPVQEPVACVIDGDLYFHHEIDWEDLAYQGHGVELLYTTPPAQRPFVGLTDEERLEVAEIDGADEWFWKVCKAIEAKLKEKNT